MPIALLALLSLWLPLSAVAQMGPGLGGPPSLFSAEGLLGAQNTAEGIEKQFLLSTGFPLAKTESLSIFSQLNYQSLALQNPTFPLLSATHFESLILSVNATYQQESGNGWLVGGSFDSASRDRNNA